MKFYLTTVCYFLFLSMLLLQMNHVDAKQKANLVKYMCDICSAVVDEAEHMISQVDPKKKVEVGSFRISPDGKSKSVKQKFSRFLYLHIFYRKWCFYSVLFSYKIQTI